MKIKQIASCLLFLIVAPLQAQNPRSSAETFEAFIGEWDMELLAEEATFGDRGGPGTGIMSCTWSPMHAWVDCELDSHYEGMGRYVLKIVLYRTAQEGTYGSFVTNSFGGGRLYLGHWESPSKLVYTDAWRDSRRKWEQQRVTYTFDEEGTITFSIEVSKDGIQYLPHSRGIYRKRAESKRSVRDE